jgi:hypothetical protein
VVRRAYDAEIAGQQGVAADEAVARVPLALAAEHRYVGPRLRSNKGLQRTRASRTELATQA